MLELKSRISDEIEREIDINVLIQPLALGYRPKCIENMSEMANQISSNVRSPVQSGDAIEKDYDSFLRFELTCAYLIISTSLEDSEYDSSNINQEVEIDNLFSRCGYRTLHPYQLYGPIGLVEVCEIKFDVSKQESHLMKGDDAEMISKTETKMLSTFQKSIISVAAPTEHDVRKVEFSGEAIDVYKFDILTLESETKIDPDALVKIEFTSKLPHESSMVKKKDTRKYFPLITPLSSIKTSQQVDNQQASNKTYAGSDDILRQRMDGSFQHQNLQSKRKVRGSNPQNKMLRNASCCTNLSIRIPSIAIDLTIQEKESLIYLCSRLPQMKTQINDLDERRENVQESNSKLGIAFSCDQVLIAVHDDKLNERRDDMCTLLTIFDGIRSHCVCNQHGLSQFRFLSHDLTLYEGKLNALLFFRIIPVTSYIHYFIIGDVKYSVISVTIESQG